MAQKQSRVTLQNKLVLLNYQAGAFYFERSGPILATTHSDFKLPLEYPDRLHIAGRSTILGPKKFNMHYMVYSEQFDAIAAEGEGISSLCYGF